MAPSAPQYSCNSPLTILNKGNPNSLYIKISQLPCAFPQRQDLTTHFQPALLSSTATGNRHFSILGDALPPKASSIWPKGGPLSSTKKILFM